MEKAFIPRNAFMMANSLADLNWTVVSQAAIETLEEELAGLSRFSLDVSNDFKNDGDSVKVETIDGAGSALKNATDWNQTALSTSAVSVMLNRYSRPAGLTYADRKNGVRMANKVQTIVRTVAKAFWSDVLTTIAGSTATVLPIGARSTFEPSVLTDTIWPSMPNGADAVYLDRMYYAKLIPTNALGLDLAAGAYSIPGGVHYVEGTSDLVTGSAGVGFATRPDALAIATRLPDIDPALELSSQIVESPKLGVSMLIKSWADKSTETTYISAELMAGVAVGNKAHLRILSSATADS